MKKTTILIILLCLLLTLAACSGRGINPAAEYVQPFSFYFRTVETDFSSPDGLIRAEVRDLGEKRYSESELFSLYFEGPQSSDLAPLFPKSTKLISVSRAGTQIFLYLQQIGDAPSAIDESIAYACIAKTAFQLQGITQVHLRTESLGGQILHEQTISDNDILLYDSGTQESRADINLYFSDSAGHLLPEKRTLPPIPEEQYPAFVIEQLLKEPQTAGLSVPLPLGTALLDYNVDLGICSVDFNADFYNNRPDSEREELVILYSIVNSLCELDFVDQVQIYVEGRKLDAYVFLDMTQPYSADLSVIAPIREDINEFEGTLCLPGVRDERLHRLPVRIRMKVGSSREESLLLELFSHPEQNTLRNPVYRFEIPAGVTVSDQVCTVDFSGHPLTMLSEAERQNAILCMTASLCQLRNISYVRFCEDGEPLGEEAYSPVPAWFAAFSEFS